MRFYFGGDYLGDNYEVAKETFLSSEYAHINSDLFEFVIENIGINTLLEWCFKQENFIEHFAKEIEDANNQLCEWCIVEVEK